MQQCSATSLTEYLTCQKWLATFHSPTWGVYACSCLLRHAHRVQWNWKSGRKGFRGLISSFFFFFLKLLPAKVVHGKMAAYQRGREDYPEPHLPLTDVLMDVKIARPFGRMRLAPLAPSTDKHRRKKNDFSHSKKATRRVHLPDWSRTSSGWRFYWLASRWLIAVHLLAFDSKHSISEHSSADRCHAGRLFSLNSSYSARVINRPDLNFNLN